MSTPTYLRSPWSLVKRLRISPSLAVQPRACFSTARILRKEDDKFPEGTKTQDAIEQNLIAWADHRGMPLPPGLNSPRRNADGKIEDRNDLSKMAPVEVEPRLPRSVQALYLRPLRRKSTHGIKVCDLQLRSYSARNLEFMADFALRAAYYLNLPAKGPVPLPRITERWTVPRSNFIFKKSQENWERITMRRLVQIQDGDADVVRKWLGFIRKWCWYGVGMKANVWEYEGLDTVKMMDENEQAVKEGLESVDWELFGTRKGLDSKKEVERLLDKEGFYASGRPKAKKAAAVKN